jgi:N-acyl-D-amino-acid deacylase
MRHLKLGFTFGMALLLSSPVQADDNKLDVVIKGGRVVDGTGSPWYLADIGIDDGLIVRIGKIPGDEAETVIDAAGLIVAPGFVDMMGQTASPMLHDPKTAVNLLTQGITTINAGEGGSAAPLNNADGRRKGYSTMAEYFAIIDSYGLPVNVVQTIGHTQVREIVLGDQERRPSEEELKRVINRMLSSSNRKVRNPSTTRLRGKPKLSANVTEWHPETLDSTARETVEELRRCWKQSGAR